MGFGALFCVAEHHMYGGGVMPDCDELRINFQFSWKTFSSKATTIASLFYHWAPCLSMLVLSLLQRVHPNEKTTWEVKRFGM